MKRRFVIYMVSVVMGTTLAISIFVFGDTLKALNQLIPQALSGPTVYKTEASIAVGEDGKIPLSKPENLSRSSSLIITGTVISNLPAEMVILGEKEKKEVIYRDTIIAIDEILRNQSEISQLEPLYVRNFGGLYENKMYEVGHQAYFQAGEKVLLFLKEDDLSGEFGPKHWRPTGGIFSKFTQTAQGDFIQSYEKTEGIAHGGGHRLSKEKIKQIILERDFVPGPH